MSIEVTDKLLIEKIKDECRRIEEDTEHSFKGHYNSAVFWSNLNLILGLSAAVFGATAGGTSAMNGADVTVTGAAFFSAIFATCLTFLKPGEKSDSHKNAGNLYQALRNKTRIFREIELLSDQDGSLHKNKIMELVERRDELNSIMPSIPRASYRKAKKDIDSGRAQYLVDKEKIDEC